MNLRRGETIRISRVSQYSEDLSTDQKQINQNKQVQQEQLSNVVILRDLQ